MSLQHSGIGRIDQVDGTIFVVTDEGDAGCVIYGPYCVLDPGSYAVEFYAMPEEIGNEICCVVDVLRRGKAIVAERDFTASELIHRNGTVTVRFEVVLRDTFEFRVSATGRSALRIRYHRPLRLLSGPELD